MANKTYVRITLPDEPGISSGNGAGALELGPGTRIEAGTSEIQRLCTLALCADRLADDLESYRQDALRR